MINRPDGLPLAAKPTAPDGRAATATADAAPRLDARGTSSAGKAEDMIALLNSRLRHGENRR